MPPKYNYYLNKNSIRNKLNDLKILISVSVDIFCISKSKPYPLYVTASSGGLLIYVKLSLPSKMMNHYEFQKDIQFIAMELKLANKKNVIFPIQRPPKQNINYFVDSLSKGLDFYPKYYENICILGDFNVTPLNPCLTLVLESQNLKI